ncbi:hypothetical protein P7H15_13135 [Paenibacillus larvae]|nr:hypothetical protein [Paenibacillus larvae]MDT2293595.1 hypothetical protein [Paenibacillus larvae]
MKSKNRFMNQMIIINQHQNEWEYWHQNLTGEIGITEFPGDAVMVQAIAEPNKRMTFDFTLPESAAAQLIKLGGNSDYAIHVILFSEVAVLLNNIPEMEDKQQAGSPIYRQEGIDGLKFMTMMLLCWRNRKRNSFKELLLQIRQIKQPMRWNTRTFPIDLLFDQLREENQTADTSLYSTVVMLENIHDKRYLDAVAYRMLFIVRGHGIRGTVHFDPDRYTEPAVAGIISHFTHLLGQALLRGS